ncbi:MAG: SH3 domain-containing protein [Anaerolineales bacterium]
MGNAIGPDVSSYQDDPETPEHIDFVKMGKTANFVIIRAGQNLWPDRDFKLNWAAAKAAGLPCGSYWFYDSRADPREQAELWVDVLDDDLGELPLFVDFEDTYNGQYSNWSNWHTFLERLKELVGQKEICVYTAYYYWRDNAPNPASETEDLEYFHQYPLWIANYGVTKPFIPKPWGTDEWLFWQFTNVGDGDLYGVESEPIDLNYFNGDVEAFRQRFGLPDLGELPPGGDGEEGNEYRIELNIRENAGMDEKAIGTLLQDEVLEVLDTTIDESWMQIKRADGTTGWIYNTHLIKVESTEPPGNGNGDGNGEPPPVEEKWFRVTAFALNVRSGPSTSDEDIGTLQQNEVVKALDYAVSNSWIKIYRPLDGLTGWSYASYLEETDAPPDTGDPSGNGNGETPGNGNGEPPDTTQPPDSEWYRSTATSLNVREGPSTDDTVIGSLPLNSVVKALAQNADGSWIEIFREEDELTGWCFASYLEPTTLPSEERRWYQVKVTTLNVRESADKDSDKLGSLSQGQIVVALESNEDGSWARIQCFDGLIGWCATAYLNDLGTTPPEQLTQRIFSGVTYFRKEMQTPRKMVAHVLAVDMRAHGLKCLITPPSHESGLVCTRRTSKFLEEFNLQVAINGDGFRYLDQNTYDPEEYCPHGGEPVKVNSYAASRGTVYSEQRAGSPIMYINKNNEVTFNKPKGAIYNAVSGDRMLVEKGKKIDTLESQSVEPRSAAGINSNGRWLFLIVIDGRQPGYSEGATFPELADFMISQGIYFGLNLDGGGSSSLVIEGALGGPVVLNSPIEGNIPGNESAVSNHLGFWVKK